MGHGEAKKRRRALSSDRAFKGHTELHTRGDEAEAAYGKTIAQAS